MKLRLAMALTIATAALIALPAAASACAYENLEPRTSSQLKKAAKATHCLINEARRDRGKRRLRWHRRLYRSARWQAKDMLKYGYFDHERSNGPSFTRRIVRFGYARRSSGYSLGENIAWGTASDATPREMVESWMDSPGHRQNILRSRFRDDAVAVIRSEGEEDGEFADFGPVLIYVHQFGKRY